MTRHSHPRRGWKWQRKGPAAPATPLTGMWLLREQYLDALKARNFSGETAKTRASGLARFITWCDERCLTAPTDITQPVIERYQQWLFYYRRPDGKPLGFSSQHHMLQAVKQFFQWLTRQRLTLFNPAAEIEMPRCARRLPRDVLTASEAEAILEQPDLNTPLGIRDRAILETFYATGIRRRELAYLSVYDVDPARGTLFVREGKGKKDRVLPIGQRALAWIDRYLMEIRPNLVAAPDEHFLFLTIDGTPYRKVSLLNDLVNRYVGAAQITKHGSCHMFRHTMATLMLENGADIRYIQEMLGHEHLTTTEIYTRVTITKLQQIYRATHPAELPTPPDRPAIPAAPASDPPPELAGLLDEADEEEREPAAGTP
jgi:integrase/recombinase XerD